MARTFMDGLDPGGDGDRPMQIVVETPYGSVRSIILPESAVAKIRATLEGGIARVQHFTVNSDAGPVLIPGNTLRESIVRFVYCKGSAPGTASGSSASSGDM